MKLSAHVCKSNAACAHEEDNIKTKTTEGIIYCSQYGVVLQIFKSTKVNYNFGGVYGKIPRPVTIF